MPLVLALLLSVLAAMAFGGEARIVWDDRGGPVAARFAEIDRLRASGARVEIRGRVCLSACTLYLGLDRLCVAPETVFGFHGPSEGGAPLPAAEFERWSRRIAAQYPPRIARWYLAKARFETRGYLRILGAELVRLGIAACPPPASAPP